jgi:hypothetical protein
MDSADDNEDSSIYETTAIEPQHVSTTKQRPTDPFDDPDRRESDGEQDMPVDDDPDYRDDGSDLTDDQEDQQTLEHHGMDGDVPHAQERGRSTTGREPYQHQQLQNVVNVAKRCGILAFFAHRTADMNEWCSALMSPHTSVHRAVVEICPGTNLTVLHRTIKALPENPAEFPYQPTYRALYDLAPGALLDYQFIELVQACHILQIELKAFVVHADPQSRLASVSRIHFLKQPSEVLMSGIWLCRARMVAKARGKPDIGTFFQMMAGYALEIRDCIKRANDKQLKTLLLLEKREEGTMLGIHFLAKQSRY